MRQENTKPSNKGWLMSMIDEWIGTCWIPMLGFLLEDFIGRSTDLNHGHQADTMGSSQKMVTWEVSHEHGSHGHGHHGHGEL